MASRLAARAIDFASQKSIQTGAVGHDAGVAGAACTVCLSVYLTPLNSDLHRVINAWPTLPDVLRTGILAMIDAASTPTGFGEWTDEMVANLAQILADTPESNAK